LLGKCIHHDKLFKTTLGVWLVRFSSA